MIISILCSQLCTYSTTVYKIYRLGFEQVGCLYISSLYIIIPNSSGLKWIYCPIPLVSRSLVPPCLTVRSNYGTYMLLIAVGERNGLIHGNWPLQQTGGHLLEILTWGQSCLYYTCRWPNEESCPLRIYRFVLSKLRLINVLVWLVW